MNTGGGLFVILLFVGAYAIIVISMRRGPTTIDGVGTAFMIFMVIAGVLSILALVCVAAGCG